MAVTPAAAGDTAAERQLCAGPSAGPFAHLPPAQAEGTVSPVYADGDSANAGGLGPLYPSPLSLPCAQTGLKGFSQSTLLHPQHRPPCSPYFQLNPDRLSEPHQASQEAAGPDPGPPASAVAVHSPLPRQKACRRLRRPSALFKIRKPLSLDESTFRSCRETSKPEPAACFSRENTLRRSRG